MLFRSISLPADRVPVVEGGPWVTQAEEVPPEAPSVSSSVAPPSTWLIDAGPLDRVTLRLLPRRAVAPALWCWQSARIGLGEVRVVARLVPASPWRSRELLLDTDPLLVPETVRLADGADGDVGDAVRGGEDGQRGFRVTIPEAALGTTAPILVEARAQIGRAHV